MCQTRQACLGLTKVVKVWDKIDLELTGATFYGTGTGTVNPAGIEPDLQPKQATSIHQTLMWHLSAMYSVTIPE
jgi:hypothetical protein